MVALPKFTAVHCGWTVGVVAPAAMLTLAGLTVAFVVSLLWRATLTPPAGAGALSATLSGDDCVGPNVVLAGVTVTVFVPTVTVRSVSGNSAGLSDFARIVVVPRPVAVIAIALADTSLPSPRKNVCDCTVATCGLSEDR